MLNKSDIRACAWAAIALASLHSPELADAEMGDDAGVRSFINQQWQRDARETGQSFRPVPMGRQAAADIVSHHARAHGVPVVVALAVAKQESGFNCSARSYQNARGIMQVIPSTAREVGVDPGRLFDCNQGAIAGVRYLRARYDATGSWQQAIREYHGGPDPRWHGSKTRAYQRSVLAMIGRMGGLNG